MALLIQRSSHRCVHKHRTKYTQKNSIKIDAVDHVKKNEYIICDIHQYLPIINVCAYVSSAYYSVSRKIHSQTKLQLTHFFANRSHFAPVQICWKLWKFIEYIICNVVHEPLEAFTLQFLFQSQLFGYITHV